jgi:hypothetical protein
MPKVTILRSLLLILFSGIMVVGTIIISTDSAEAYSYPGYKWGVNYMRYELNIAGWASQPIHNARNSWNGANSPFLFNYVGDTAYPRQLDGHNIVTRANRGSSWPLAITQFWCIGAPCSSGKLLQETDIEFNDYYSWGAYGEPNMYDLESAAVHEFGHTLFLGHSNSWCLFSWQASMCDGMGTGQFWKRTLAGDDVNGINYIY